MDTLAVEWNGPPTNGTKLNADVHAGLLLTTASLIAPGVAQFAMFTVRTAFPKPTRFVIDHPLPVNPVVSIRPEGRAIVTLQVGVSRA